MSAASRWLVHEPKAFGAALAVASLWRERCSDRDPGASIYRVVDEATGPQAPQVHQFVTRDGRLEHNAWLWLERAGGVVESQPIPLSPAECDTLPVGSVVLVPKTVADALMPLAGVELIEQTDAEQAIDAWQLVNRADGGSLLRAHRDLFGRIVASDGAVVPMSASADDEAVPRILLVGEERHLRARYPGVLMALGDASDALGIRIDVRLHSPRTLSPDSASALLASSDAVVLPGGCDNSQVAGMIELAGQALAQDVPTLGLCFGMQAMVTAAIRTRLGQHAAQMEEIAPDATCLSIVGMPGLGEGLQHRLGEQASQVRSGTRLADIHGSSEIRERMNHRYRLAPRWESSLADAGIIVSARSNDGAEIADAIEAADRRFYVGYQGHPELISRPQRPHPAFMALLNEAGNASPHHVFDRKDR